MTEKHEDNLSQAEVDKEDFMKLFAGFLMIASIGLAYFVYLNTDWGLFFDFESKKYVPYTYNNELLLINIKNGKTYKLEYNKTDDKYFYRYKFIARPKAKKNIYFNIQNNKTETTPNGVKYKILDKAT